MTTFKYVLATLAAVALSWPLHELAHWLTGELLGYDMTMTLNATYPTGRKYLHEWHGHVMSAAGPILTILQALLIYFLLKRNGTTLLFPFLVTCLYMRLMAAGISFLNPNDEARISKALGIGMFTLPLLVSGLLFFLTYDVSKARKLKTKLILWTVFLIMFFSSILILSDQAFKVKLLS
ncbi:hypothetical protein [Rufibacter hautae]|uniref:DUF3267 domain-containing protein n=1 Tax=Rufibacter hautae TaxID=2595005 RepID=A0A5B6TLN5_9BACT|nr:hypothetical protein [Rufibacter hautae]KAA3440390.1 hypothetical protein FOA19_06985 [Rufibacter hautae]